MKTFQSNYISRLLQPKAMIFGIALFNFLWTYFETLQPLAGRGIMPAWYSTKEFPLPQLLLFTVLLLLYVPKIWSYTTSVLISGYFVVSWTFLFIDWFWTTNYSLPYRIEIITSSYSDNPLQIWESQIVIAILIFSVSFYHFVKEIFRLKTNTDKHT